MAFQFGYPETKPVGTGGSGPLFSEKRCFVTGASSGIGFGLAKGVLLRVKEDGNCTRNKIEV